MLLPLLLLVLPPLPLLLLAVLSLSAEGKAAGGRVGGSSCGVPLLPPPGLLLPIPITDSRGMARIVMSMTTDTSPSPPLLSLAARSSSARQNDNANGQEPVDFKQISRHVG